MDGAHGNGPYQRAMAQRPEPLRRPPYTELAFFRRLLRKQGRELAEISKKAYQRDHSSRSRETLEARSRTRETRQAIENIVLEMSNKSREGRDRDGAPPATLGATRLPESPTPTPPPVPPKPPRPTGADIMAAPPHREVKRRKIETPKVDPEHSRPPPLRRFRPTPIPCFDPSRPPPARKECVRELAPPPQPPLLKTKAPGRASAHRRPFQGQPGR